MENPKLKLSFKHWGEKLSIEKDHSDITLDEFYEMCKHLALAAGFGSHNVEEIFGEL